MSGIPAPPNVPPLGLYAMREPRFTLPIPVNRGREVNYNDLVPGKHYYIQTSLSNPMVEMEFVEHRPKRQFLARHLPLLRDVRNRAGNPLYAVYEPMAPHPAGAAGAPMIYEQHAWPHYKFYEVSKLKRLGRFINPNITKKAKRQAIINALNRRLSTVAGTGPANTVLKFTGLQPPQGAQGGKRRISSTLVEMAKSRRTHGRRVQRKTRKQTGGANASRLAKNIKKAAALAKPEEGQPQGSSNLYYAPVDEKADEGYALIIGPRIATEGDVTLRNAVYPYEECIVVLHFNMGGEYPLKPPHVLHLTSGILGAGNYRIHPNLYEVHGTDLSYSRKTCLGILGTWGANEWKSTMGPADVVQGIMGILEANPGTYEPGGASYKSPYPEGILYNQHTFAECVEITCAIYKAVLRAVSADATSNSISISEKNIERAGIPKELAPFVENLARRAYSGLSFLIGKVEEFIRLHGKPILDLHATMHKKARRVDFGKLLACLKEAREMVPRGLRNNIFKYGLGEIHRALYDLSNPKWPNGRKKTYEEFVEEIEARNRSAAATAASSALAAAGAGAGVGTSDEGENEEEEANETQYVYSNTESYGNNGSPVSKSDSPGALEELND